MRSAQAQIHEFPQQPRSSAYSDGYCAGLNDGQKFAQVQFFWIGLALGIVIAGALVLAIVVFTR